MIDTNFREKITKFKRINARLSYIQNNITNNTLVNSYALMERMIEKEKNKFHYESLEQTQEKIPKHDAVIVELMSILEKKIPCVLYNVMCVIQQCGWKANNILMLMG